MRAPDAGALDHFGLVLGVGLVLRPLQIVQALPARLRAAEGLPVELDVEAFGVEEAFLLRDEIVEAHALRGDGDFFHDRFLSMPRARQRFVVMMPIILARPVIANPAVGSDGTTIGTRGAGTQMDFSLSAEQEAIRDAIEQDLRALRRRLLARPRTATAASRTSSTGRFADAGWLGIAMPGGVRRRGPRHHRGRDDDAGDRRVGRRLVRRLGGAHEHLRAEPGRGVRHARSRSSACCRR